ncbi:MAG: two-component regulator propeller domain-containing protein [Bacteroidota bacterium]
MRTAYYRLLCCFLFLVSSLCGLTQEYQPYVTNYGVKDGLYHREVNAIFQDRDGLMWLGTKFGLNRFDGYEFKWWTKDEAGNEFNNINRIAQDEEGLLWLFMGAPGGAIDTIVLLHPYSGQVQSLEEKFGERLPFYMSDLSNKALALEDGTLFFGHKTKKQLLRYRSEEGFVWIPLNDFEVFEPKAYSVQQTIWGIADDHKVVEVDQEGRVLQAYVHPSELDLNNCFLRNGVFWFAERVEQGKLVRSYQMIPGEGVRQIDETVLPGSLIQLNDFGCIRYNPIDELVWLQHADKLEVIRPGGDVLFTLTDDYPDLRSSFVRGWAIDDLGRTWVGGNFGVYVIDLKPRKFTNYLTASVTRKLLSPNSCRGILLHGDELIVATENRGLQQCNLQTQDITILEQKNFIQEYLGRALYKDRDDRVWIGKNELIQFDLTARAPIKTVTYDPADRREHLRIWSIFQDRQKNIWVGTEGGLNHLPPGARYIQPFHKYGAFEELVSRSFILHLGEDRAGDVWICTNTGLYHMGTDQNIIARYWRGGEGAYKLPAQNFQHFYEDEQGIFWLATAGNGGLNLNMPPNPIPMVWRRHLSLAKSFWLGRRRA